MKIATTKKQFMQFANEMLSGITDAVVPYVWNKTECRLIRNFTPEWPAYRGDKDIPAPAQITMTQKWQKLALANWWQKEADDLPDKVSQFGWRMLQEEYALALDIMARPHGIKDWYRNPLGAIIALCQTRSWPAPLSTYKNWKKTLLMPRWAPSKVTIKQRRGKEPYKTTTTAMGLVWEETIKWANIFMADYDHLKSFSKWDWMALVRHPEMGVKYKPSWLWKVARLICRDWKPSVAAPDRKYLAYYTANMASMAVHLMDEMFQDVSMPKSPAKAARLIKETEFLEQLKGSSDLPFHYIPADFKLPGLYVAVPLLTGEDLVDEGINQNHCVGQYVHRCQTGKSFIYSLRELSDEGEKTLITAEIKHGYEGYTMAQFYGHSNTMVPQYEHLRVLMEAQLATFPKPVKGAEVPLENIETLKELARSQAQAFFDTIRRENLDIKKARRVERNYLRSKAGKTETAAKKAALILEKKQMKEAKKLAALNKKLNTTETEATYNYYEQVRPYVQLNNDDQDLPF